MVTISSDKLLKLCTELYSSIDDTSDTQDAIDRIREEARKLMQPLTQGSGETHHRDADWVLAMAQALGTDSGYSVPIAPTPEAFRALFDALRTTQTQGQEAETNRELGGRDVREIIQELRQEAIELRKKQTTLVPFDADYCDMVADQLGDAWERAELALSGVNTAAQPPVTPGGESK